MSATAGSRSRGSAAPASTQLHEVGDHRVAAAAASPAASREPSSWRIAWMSRLSSGLPGTTAGPRIAAAEHARPRIEPQAPLAALSPGARMALVAVALQHRLDLLAEEADVLGIVGPCELPSDSDEDRNEQSRRQMEQAQSWT